MIKEHIPVFYEGQDDLVDVLATSIASVCCNTKSFIDFYILDCGLHEVNKKLLEEMKEKFHNFSIRFLPVDIKQFKGLKGYGWNNFVDPYSRLLIPELVPELNKAIYLDADTLVVRDIKLLWDKDLHNKSIAVVPDLGFKGKLKQRFIYELGGNAGQLFMHAGAYILNCKKWRNQNTTAKLLRLANEKKDKLYIIIEELFSLYFENDYQLLDCRYCMTDSKINFKDIAVDKITPEYLENEYKQIIIMHFAGTAKPWNTNKPAFSHQMSIFFRLFWNYAQMTPFCKGMEIRMIENLRTLKTFEYKYLFFGIPFLTVRSKKNTVTYKLFGLISFLRRKGI